MRLRVCLEAGCGELTPFSRCEPHAKENAERVRVDRDRLEPWRYVYGLASWHEAREARRRQDGFACVFCGELELHGGPALEVHHRIPLRVLWERAGGGTERFARWEFERAACYLEHLATACSRCNRDEDERLRREEADRA